MPFMVKSKKLAYAFLIAFCLFNYACSQSGQKNQQLGLEYEKKALQLQTKEDYNKALEYQLKAIELNPNKAKSYAVLSSLYVDLNEPQKAVEAAKNAVSLEPQNAENHYQLAVASRRIEDFQKALQEFQEAVKLSPNSTNYLINLGGTFEDLDDRISARQSYEKALTVDSNYVPAIYLLGELEVEDGNIDKAIELFKKASEIKIPENRQAEQSNSQQDAKRRLQELETKKRTSPQKKP